MLAPYNTRQVQQPNYTNSAADDQLLKDGKLRLSLDDAIALTLENNLDLAIARYNLSIADTDILRTQAGAAVQGVNTGIVQGTPGGAGLSVTGASGTGVGGTSAAAGGVGTGTGGLVLSTAGAGPNAFLRSRAGFHSERGTCFDATGQSIRRHCLPPAKRRNCPTSPITRDSPPAPASR